MTQCHQKDPEGINTSANLHIFSIPTLYVLTQRGNILSCFQHESQLLSGTWMDEEITDIRVRDWVILIMTECNLIFSSTYIIIIIYVIWKWPISPLKANFPLPQQTGLWCVMHINLQFLSLALISLCHPVFSQWLPPVYPGPIYPWYLE